MKLVIVSRVLSFFFEAFIDKAVVRGNIPCARWFSALLSKEEGAIGALKEYGPNPDGSDVRAACAR